MCCSSFSLSFFHLIYPECFIQLKFFSLYWWVGHILSITFKFMLAMKICILDLPVKIQGLSNILTIFCSSDLHAIIAEYLKSVYFKSHKISLFYISVLIQTYLHILSFYLFNPFIQDEFIFEFIFHFSEEFFDILQLSLCSSGKILSVLFHS